jgi:hypothetical protein
MAFPVGVLGLIAMYALVVLCAAAFGTDPRP